MLLGYECEVGIFRSLLWETDSVVALGLLASWHSLESGQDL